MAKRWEFEKEAKGYITSQERGSAGPEQVWGEGGATEGVILGGEDVDRGQMPASSHVDTPVVHGGRCHRNFHGDDGGQA